MELAHDQGNVTAAIFLLKGLRPEKYKERNSFDIKHLLDLDPDKLTDEQVKHIVRVLERKAEMEEAESNVIEGYAETVEPD